MKNVAIVTDEETVFSYTWFYAGWQSSCQSFGHTYPHIPYDGYNPPQFADF
jgi:hypothetical protein